MINNNLHMLIIKAVETVEKFLRIQQQHHYNHCVWPLILLIVGLKTFMTIINLYGRCIMNLWKVCLNKYQLWNLKNLFRIQIPVTIDRYWRWLVHQNMGKSIPPLRKQNTSKKHKRKMIKVKGNYKLKSELELLEIPNTLKHAWVV